MFDPRWDDDPRDRDEGSRDLSRGSRGGGPDPRDRDRPDPRDVFVAPVDLPRGRDREHVHYRGHDYTLRGSESRTLSCVGAFRVIPATDLRDTFDKPLDPRHGELWHLREAGLVQTVRIDRDTTVVTLTREGRDLLESRRWDKEHDPPDRDRQAFHDGIQRPRELKHDAELYRGIGPTSKRRSGSTRRARTSTVSSWRTTSKPSIKSSCRSGTAIATIRTAGQTGPSTRSASGPRSITCRATTRGM